MPMSTVHAMHPLSQMGRLRYYGVFAATHRLPAQVVPKPVALAVVEGDVRDKDRYRVA